MKHASAMSVVIALLAACRGMLGIDPDALPAVDATNEAGVPPSDAEPPPPTSTAYRDAVLHDHPVAYWSFDEQPGASAARDRIGELAAVAHGLVGFGARGIAHTAVQLDGASYLDVGDAFSFANAPAFSFEAWIWPESGAGEFHDFINKRSGGGALPYVGYVGYIRQQADGISTIRFALDSPTGSREVSAPSVLRQWQHVVATVNPSAGLCLYVDGSPRGCQSTPWSSTTTTTSLYFGKSESGAGLVGSLDELAIYDYALGADRIAEHSRLGQR